MKLKKYNSVDGVSVIKNKSGKTVAAIHAGKVVVMANAFRYVKKFYSENNLTCLYWVIANDYQEFVELNNKIETQAREAREKIDRLAQVYEGTYNFIFGVINNKIEQEARS